MSLPKMNQAVVIKGKSQFGIETLPLPKVLDQYILVKTSAVALNPIDWKGSNSYVGDSTGCRAGCDYSGRVVQVGKDVKQTLEVGDRVCGFVFGQRMDNHDSGSFGEYVIAKGDLQIKVPENLSDEEAATLGAGITTVGQGLYQNIKLPLPTSPAPTPFPVLIYGASSATGMLATQLSKQSGLTVLAVCSPRNFDVVRSLGADEVFDYNSSHFVQEIRKSTDGKLAYIWDIIATKETALSCAEAMSSDGGHYGVLSPMDFSKVTAINPNIKCGLTSAFTCVGEDFFRMRHWDASKEDFEFAQLFWSICRELLAAGKLKPSRPAVNQGGSGLGGVLVGLEKLRSGKVSGDKLVYTMS